MEINPPASNMQEFAPFVEGNGKIERQKIYSASKPGQRRMVGLIAHYS
jgi:hypothetical protein